MNKIKVYKKGSEVFAAIGLLLAKDRFYICNELLAMVGSGSINHELFSKCSIILSEQRPDAINADVRFRKYVSTLGFNVEDSHVEDSHFRSYWRYSLPYHLENLYDQEDWLFHVMTVKKNYLNDLVEYCKEQESEEDKNYDKIGFKVYKDRWPVIKAFRIVLEELSMDDFFICNIASSPEFIPNDPSLRQLLLNILNSNRPSSSTCHDDLDKYSDTKGFVLIANKGGGSWWSHKNPQTLEVKRRYLKDLIVLIQNGEIQI